MSGIGKYICMLFTIIVFSCNGYDNTERKSYDEALSITNSVMHNYPFSLEDLRKLQRADSLLDNIVMDTTLIRKALELKVFIFNAQGKQTEGVDYFSSLPESVFETSIDRELFIESINFSKSDTLNKSKVNKTLEIIEQYYDQTGTHTELHKKILSEVLVGSCGEYPPEQLQEVVTRFYEKGMLNQDTYDCVEKMIGAAMAVNKYQDLINNYKDVLSYPTPFKKELTEDYISIELRNDCMEPYYTFWGYNSQNKTETELLIRHFFELKYSGFNGALVYYSMMGNFIANQCKEDEFYIKELLPGEKFKYFIKGDVIGQYYLVNLSKTYVDSLLGPLSGNVLYKHDYTIVNSTNAISIYSDSTKTENHSIRVKRRFTTPTSTTLF